MKCKCLLRTKVINIFSTKAICNLVKCSSKSFIFSLLEFPLSVLHIKCAFLVIGSHFNLLTVQSPRGRRLMIVSIVVMSLEVLHLNTHVKWKMSSPPITTWRPEGPEQPKRADRDCWEHLADASVQKEFKSQLWKNINCVPSGALGIESRWTMMMASVIAMVAMLWSEGSRCLSWRYQ